MAVQATFQSMGLRVEKAVAAHLLLENTHESNLVPDIARVDYLAGNLGRTHLRPLEGLSTFVDDVYVFGYLRREDCVVRGGSLSCTTGEGGAAKNTIHRIANAVYESVGKAPDGSTRGHIQTNLVHTIAVRERTEGSAIRETIARIEFDTQEKALGKWRELYPGDEPAGLFVAKVNVSEIPMSELQASLPAFERHLLPYGYGLYSIDYTRDFSGVLDRKTLAEHLCAFEGFREQGDLADAMRDRTPTILENTDSVGNHVCTWVCTSEAGYTVRTKIYNKVVSNFKAGEVREPIGGNLADYVDCPNQHLRQTFLHLDVQARGCTRIEVSLYACSGWDLSAETATEVVEEALALVCPQDLPEEEGLFVVQPPAKQWENLAACLDRCLVLADRPQGTIFVAWYAHTTTGRVSGVRVRPTKANADASWERAVEWAAADFGFRACPIFRVDILAADEEGVELGPLRCYTKDADASTILAASKRSTQLHPDGPNPETLLPSSAAVSWVWRTAKCHAVGKDVSAFHLHEVPEIAEGRTISTLSTRNREKRLQEIRDAASAEDWRRRAWKWLEAERQLHEEEQRRRAEELDRIAQLVAAGRQYAEKSRETAIDVGTALGVGGTGKVADLAAAAAGATQQEADAQLWRKNPRVVLRDAADPDTVVVWATKGLGAILDGCADLFESKTDNRHGRITYWLPPAGRLARLEIEIEPTRVFRSRDGRQISWNPIGVVAAPDPQRLAALQALAEKEQEHRAIEVAHQEAEQRATLLEAPAPKPMDTTKAIDLPPGEYIFPRYASTTFRGAPRTLLFLVPTGENGEPTTDIETPTYGHFLEKEVGTLGGVEALRKARAPLLCNLGAERTTPQKKKDRLASVAVA
ncbi:hypothetical protein RRG08_032318 [Elysia crispata]|uniref:Uncharacterized protein n=1 Tax=Elysia crispata TaxID=231223 RepID=A0AAE1ASS7_9GAST|nr:hypothetical protein RRG08_032318 [Elysia crispata]